jgi:hypothetical protein
LAPPRRDDHTIRQAQFQGVFRARRSIESIALKASH